MIVVNSVCGCAAGKARPGIAMALQNARRPDVVGDRVRRRRHRGDGRARASYFAPYPPSSPSVALMRDGKLVFMLRAARHRDPRRRDCEQLTAAFDEYCAS